jgi:hypothetical protein
MLDVAAILPFDYADVAVAAVTKASPPPSNK